MGGGVSRYEYPLDDQEMEHLTSVLKVPCRTCGAPAGFQCMSEASRYLMDQHESRRDKARTLRFGMAIAKEIGELATPDDATTKRLERIEATVVLLCEKLGVVSDEAP